jgi:hypothetical protein
VWLTDAAPARSTMLGQYLSALCYYPLHICFACCCLSLVSRSFDFFY